MSEWERMQKGLVYNDFDEDLFKRRVEAKKIFKEYNKTSDEDVALRNELLNKLFKRIGKNVGLNLILDVNLGKILFWKIIFI